MNNLSKPQRKWYVIVSKTTHYKRATIILEKLGLSFYLPMQRQLHYWSDRKKWVNVPILKPYIFLFINELERKLIYQSCDFFHFLNLGDKPAIAREDEIEKVKLLCNHSSNVRIEQQPIKKGDLVEIIGGPFSGMNGYMSQENGRHRFLIHILSLGQFASVDIESSLLSVC